MAWLDTIRELWPLITALAGIAVVIATLWLRSKFTPIEDHRAVVKRVGVLETHASGIDERVKHAEALLNQAPTRQELQEDRRTLEALRQKAQSAQEEMLADIDLGGQEIEELERMRDTYAQRINRLTQQVEEQVSQLDRLRRAYNENIEAAERLRAEAQQADAEYERLLRERQQRDRDLKLLREQIAERTAILQGLIKQQRDLGDVQIDESALKPVPPRGGRPRLPGGSPRRLPDGRGD